LVYREIERGPDPDDPLRGEPAAAVAAD